MSSSLFSVRAKGISPGDRELIKKLTKIRVSGYKVSMINKELAEQNYKMIPAFTKDIGDDILKVNLIDSKGMEAFKTANSQFKKIVDELSSFSQVVYAAQLLQYYTIICDEKFNPSGSFQEFQDFLTKNSTKFGDVSTNLLITEYKLIKIFNNLVSFIESHEQMDESLRNIEEKLLLVKLKQFSSELTSLKDAINNWLNDAPDNVFLHYLLFVCCYTFAKSFELHYILHEKKISEEEQLKLEKLQETYLKLANDEIDTIYQLNQFIADRGFKYVKGLEFCLGQELLHKLPESNIDKMKKHLISLLSANTTESGQTQI